jgi:hypothetical protein
MSARRTTSSAQVTPAAGKSTTSGAETGSESLRRRTTQPEGDPPREERTIKPTNTGNHPTYMDMFSPIKEVSGDEDAETDLPGK